MLSIIHICCKIREIKESMIKIFLFDEHANSAQNGIGTYLEGLKYCLSSDFRVTVLSFNDSVGSFVKETKDGVEYMRFPVFCGGSFLANHEVGLSIIRMEVADCPDNIFVLNYFLCNELLVGLKACYPLSKTVFVVHDQIWTERLLGDMDKFKAIADNIIRDVENHGNNYELLQRHIIKEMKMYALADKVVVMNGDTESLLRTSYMLPQEKIRLIPNGKDVDGQSTFSKSEIRRELLVGEQDKLILFVGRTTKCKGFEATLTAFERLSKACSTARLVVIGNVYDLENVARLCPKSKTRIIFTGQLKQNELAKWYQVADVGLMASYCEQCGFVGIEMMAHGLPIVASDGLGVRVMFKDGHNAVVVKIGNRQNSEEYACNLAKAMARVLEMEACQLKEMKCCARQTYLARYAMATMKESYVTLFSEMIADGKDEEVAPVAKIPNKGDVYRLILQCGDLSDIGLFDGRMGCIIALMEYADRYGVASIVDFCVYMINKSVTALPANMAIGFGSGIMGIAFALDYLCYSGLINIDTSEVCREIDKRLMQYSPLRMYDLSLEKGLEGMLMYVNIHMYNNRGYKVFADSFVAEIRKRVSVIPNDAQTDNMKKQIALFQNIADGMKVAYCVSLLEFVRDCDADNITLSHGLAGKIVKESAEW